MNKFWPELASTVHKVILLIWCFLLYCRVSSEVTYQKSVWGFVRSEYALSFELIMLEPTMLMRHITELRVWAISWPPTKSSITIC